MTTRRPRHALALLIVAALATACAPTTQPHRGPTIGQALPPNDPWPPHTWTVGDPAFCDEACVAANDGRTIIPPRRPTPPPADGGPIICAPHPCGFEDSPK